MASRALHLWLAVTLLSCAGEPAREAAPLIDRERVPRTQRYIEPTSLPFHAVGPVALVDGAEISAQSFNRGVFRMELILREMPPRIHNRYKRRLVDLLVDEHLIDRRCPSRELPSREQIDSELEAFRRRFSAQQRYEKYLASRQMTEAELRDGLGERATRRACLLELAGVEIAPDEVRALYEREYARFNRPEQVRASHILLKVPKGTPEASVARRAKVLAEKARQPGADFAALARRHSEGPAASRGGDLGFFPRARMVKPFSDVAFALGVGEVSDPVRTQFGFHVIKVSARRPAQSTRLEEVEGALRARLEERAVQQFRRELLEREREQAEIQYRMDNIRDEAPRE